MQTNGQPLINPHRRPGISNPMPARRRESTAMRHAQRRSQGSFVARTTYFNSIKDKINMLIIIIIEWL